MAPTQQYTPADPLPKKLIIKWFQEVCKDAQKQKAQYRTACQWCCLIKAKFGQVSHALTQKRLHTVLSKDPATSTGWQAYEAFNPSGVFYRDKHQLISEVTEKDGKLVSTKRNIQLRCYIAGKPGGSEPKLPIGQDWWNTVSKHNLFVEGRKRDAITLFSPTEKKRVCTPGTNTPSQGITSNEQIPVEKITVKFKLSSLFQCPRDTSAPGHSFTHSDIIKSSKALAAQQDQKRVQQLLNFGSGPAKTTELPEAGNAHDNAFDWSSAESWESTRARKLFLPVAGESVRDSIQRRILLLDQARTKKNGHKDLLIGGDPYNNCTENDLFKLHDTCLFLKQALLNALDHFPKHNWGWCCDEASASVSRLLDTKCCGRTIERKWTVFRQRNQFHHPRGAEGLKASYARRNMSPFFQANSDMLRKLEKYCLANLGDLTVDLAREYIMDTLYTEAAKRTPHVWDHIKILSTAEQNVHINNWLKADFGVSRVTSFSTVYRWLKKLGFKYEMRKKRFYVDTHEAPANRLYRKKHTKRYLQQYEPRMHRWFQMTKTEARRLEDADQIPKGSGYHYFADVVDCQLCNPMVEYHIDALPQYYYDKYVVPLHKFGGALSVRKPPNAKPLISFGHDEVIFKQYIHTGKSWRGPNGETAMVPKDEGYGWMVSGFQSREFGFGKTLSSEQLRIINQYRRAECPRYTEKESCQKLGVSDKKKDLTDSPFVKYFEYGAKHEGYWTYDHMSMQFEDVVDCCMALHGSDYDFLFTFDHSCGHDRSRPDGLIISKMNATWGGFQAAIRDMKIEAAEGFLGPFGSTLKVGDIQHSHFQEDDEGPYYMTDATRRERKYDRMLAGSKPKAVLRADLVRQLTAKKINCRGRSMEEVQNAATQHGIPIETEVQNEKEGWVGKPKGIRQILHERGLLDPDVSYVAIISKTDKHPEGKVTYSSVLEQCFDFENEKTSLMYLGDRLGVTVDRTAKCHPELAGEGIEYSWGKSKGVYRRARLSSKRGKSNFHNLVRLCLSTDPDIKGSGGLSKDVIRKFSRRARQYMQAYYFLDNGLNNEADEFGLSEICIEKQRKLFKNHRSALDFDVGFINAVNTKSSCTL